MSESQASAGSGVPAAAASGRVAWPTLVAFGLPAAGYSFYLFFVQFYFLKFATDVLLLAPAAIGLLFGAGRIWDAVSDPLAGYWSDRTRTRLGRRRPWLFVAIPLLAVSFVMLWSPPAGLGPGALMLWSGAALVGFYSAFTVYSVPHQSLGAEISRDHHERSRVFAAQRIAFVLGMMFAFVAIDFATNAEAPRAATARLAMAAVAFASLLLLVSPVALREPREHQGRGAGSPYRALRDVLVNPHARILLGVWFVEGLGGGVLGVLSPFYTQYIFKRPDLIAVVPAFFVLASICSIPIWVATSRRYGKRNVWLVALAGNAIFFGATFFIGEGQVVLLCVILAGAGASMGCGGVIGQSMLADVIDYDEYSSGERKEGAYSAAWGFALKLAIGLVIMLTGFALQASGFVPNAEQTPTAALTLRGLFAGAPVVAALLGFAILSRFRLDRAEHARIREALDARGSAG